MSKTSTQILDAAESMIREGGYYGFSFRQIADQLAIKSASVHYHFPTKEALAIAVAERYKENFLNALGDPSRDEAVSHYASLFRKALASDGRACLCGILAAETGKIPDPLRATLREFSDKNIAWIESAYQARNPDWSAQKCHQAALALFSALEGGITFAALHDQADYLENVIQSLISLTTD